MNSNIPEKIGSYQDGMRVFSSESRIIADYMDCADFSAFLLILGYICGILW